MTSFHCLKCGKYTERSVRNLKAGGKVLCYHCGATLYIKNNFIKPPELPEFVEYDLQGKPIEYAFCNSCGARFDKARMLLHGGEMLCPVCLKIRGVLP